MSKIALSGNASGTGTLTIASQNTNSNYTLTIPNETGTLTTTASTPTFTGAVTAPSFIPNGSSAPTNGLYLPAANAVGIATNSTVALTIDSSQQVGIGTSSPGGKFEVVTNSTGLTGLAKFTNNATSGGDVNIAIFANQTATQGFIGVNTGSSVFNIGAQGASTPLVFYANGNERARITSGGQFCINTTAAVVDANSKFVVSNKVASGVAAEFSNNVSGTACVLINNEGAATSTLINWYAANAFRSSVTWNGTNIIYGTPSDQRLKENIVNSSSALPLINAIKIRSFDWKENGNHIDFGVIAQELESVIPEAVLKGKDNEDGSIKESWSVDTSTLVPALIKAAQEINEKVEELKAITDTQATRIEALEAEIAALKGTN